MSIQIYQFIQYAQDTAIDQIEKVHKIGAVVCFDFEDGIQDPIDPKSTSVIKKKHRAYFLRLYALISKSPHKVKIGIRLNGYKTSDFELDLETIKEKKYDSIILPKIENSEEIIQIVNQLKAKHVIFEHLIPTIETHKGLTHLEEITRSTPAIDKIAFGHCDYNLSLNIFPFFHQDSKEYWKWIETILSQIDKLKITFLNSPYLFLNNDDFVCSMLNHLATKTGNNFGQFTLTTHQSRLCLSNQKPVDNFNKLLENKNKIAAGIQVAEDLINEFELFNHKKGLSKTPDRIISFQEYLAAKNLIHDSRDKIELCFVGGCFPVQHNIVYEDLFHQLLKRKFEAEHNYILNINIIRYERFSGLMDKIKRLSNLKKLDLIIFHIRPEPYLRLIKFYYKYINDKGKLSWSFNLPYLKLLKPEKFDLLNLRSIFRFQHQVRDSKLHKVLVTTNYLMGKFIGNQKFALNSYLKTTNQVLDFCSENNIKPVILGPNRRRNTWLEPGLCTDLNHYILKHISAKYYIAGFDADDQEEESLTQKNGIHASNKYHRLIADKLYRQMINLKHT